MLLGLLEAQGLFYLLGGELDELLLAMDVVDPLLEQFVAELAEEGGVQSQRNLCAEGALTIMVCYCVVKVFLGLLFCVEGVEFQL